MILYIYFKTSVFTESEAFSKSLFIPDIFVTKLQLRPPILGSSLLLLLPQ